MFIKGKKQKDKLSNELNYLSSDVSGRSKFIQDIYCALCGMKRRIWVNDSKLSAIQHIQTVLVSVFLAWALFPIMGMGSLFLYPFVWLFADLGKKVLYRRGAQCHYCGFDAITYKKDVRKAKQLVKNHIDSLGRPVLFQRGYNNKQVLEETLKQFNSDL